MTFEFEYYMVLSLEDIEPRRASKGKAQAAILKMARRLEMKRGAAST